MTKLRKDLTRTHVLNAAGYVATGYGETFMMSPVSLAADAIRQLTGKVLTYRERRNPTEEQSDSVRTCYSVALMKLTQAANWLRIVAGKIPSEWDEREATILAQQGLDELTAIVRQANVRARRK